jgi:putative peptidoglycan lipid II flippase
LNSADSQGAAAAPSSGDEGATGVVGSSAALSLVALLSVATSFSWDIAIAARFGISSESDSFYYAYTFPSIIAFLAYISAYSVLLPAVARRLGQHDASSAWQLFAVVSNVVLVATVVVSIAGVVTSHFFLNAFAPGFDASTSESAAQMSVIMFSTLILAVGFELCRTGLYACNHLLVPAVLTVVCNLVITGFVLVGSQRLGVTAAAWGVVAGKTTQLLLIVPFLLRVHGFRYHWSLRLSTDGAGETLRGFFAPLSGVGLRRMVVLVERGLAASLAPGSITALDYGSRLGTVVGTVYYDSITTAVLPRLSVDLGLRRMKSAREHVVTAVKLVTFGSIPAVIILVMLREPIVSVLFERGKVSSDEVALTAAVLAVYSVGLFGVGHFRVLQNYFYAAEERMTVLALFVMTAVVNVALDVVLVNTWGAEGIALAFVLSTAIASVVGYAVMWPKLGGWPIRELGAFAIRCGISAGGCALAIVAFELLWPWEAGSAASTQMKAVYGAAASAAGILAYGAASLLLQTDDTKPLLHLVRRRFIRNERKVAPDDHNPREARPADEGAHDGVLTAATAEVDARDSRHDQSSRAETLN